MSLRRTALTLAATGLATATAFALTPGAAQAAQIRVDHVARAKHVSADSRPPSRSHNRHWKLTYVDQFTKPLDTNHVWSIYDGQPSSNVNTAYWKPSHVTRTDAAHGQLHINGYVDRAAKSDGRVVSAGLGMWKRPSLYGKYQMLVRMDSCTDVKYAWMLWPYSNRWPQDGEVDFAEDEGGNRSRTTASLSYAMSNGSRGAAPQDAAEPAHRMNGWHVIGVEWTPHSVRYTMDGRYWGATKTSHVPHTPMVLVMQTEGKALPGHVSLQGRCNADIGWVAQYAYRR